MSKRTFAQLGGILRQARRAAGLTLEDAAAQTGIEWTVLVAIEQGLRAITEDQLTTFERVYAATLRPEGQVES